MEKKLQVVSQLSNEHKEKMKDLLVEIEGMRYALAEIQQNVRFLNKNLERAVKEINDLINPQPEGEFPF